MQERGFKTLVVTKRSAARSQLHSAIELWFVDGDPVSIHTLAVAAHDCFHALLAYAKKPSQWDDWLATKSEGFRKQRRLIQNFFKHGHKGGLKAKIQYNTIHADMLMLDSIVCYQHLTDGTTTRLMRLFMTRLFYEHPALMTEEAKPLFSKDFEVYQLHETTRRQFYRKLFPLLIEEP